MKRAQARAILALTKDLQYERYPYDVTEARSMSFSGSESNEDVESVPGFKVYPNPASEMATVELENAPPGSELIVYNVLGMEVQREVVGQQSVLKLNTNEWNNGMYLFVLKTNGTVHGKQKVIISK